MEEVMQLTEAIKFFGSKQKIATALNIHRSAVTNWGSEIPLARQFQIQILTKNKLKASEPNTA
jgi:DNA invertase Pin-like site-specific DNA recombinase